MANTGARLAFYGVRGSVPTPGKTTARVGGNTSCVEVQTGGKARIVFDAGTGLRELGRTLIHAPETEVHILLSHYHWDHMLGLPFFAPIFHPRSRLHIYGERKDGGGPREAMIRQFAAPHFPVVFDLIESHVTFHEVAVGDKFRIGQASVVVGKLNHPQGAIAYRVNTGGKSVVYASDHEHDGTGDGPLVEFAHKANALIYDAMFTDETYGQKRGWGHSTWQEAIRVAKAAGVRNLYLFHHDPIHDDKTMDAIGRRARKLFAGATVAREGLVVKL